MFRSSGTMTVLVSAMLILTMTIPFLPHAGGEDVTPPVITDITEGTPVVGENFTVRVLVTDEGGVFKVHLHPHLIVLNDFILLDVTPMEHLVGDEYVIALEIPINAMELKYSVTARDYSNNGNSLGVISRPVLDNILPAAHCETPIALDMGVTHIFNGSASTDNVGIENYTWAFNYDGAPVHLYGPTPSFTFLLPGQFSGTLRVKDYSGNADSMGFLVAVGDTVRPLADPGLQIQASVDEPIMFDGSGSSDNVGIVNYTWAFVHNGTQVLLYGVSPTFTFRAPGVYEVALTVRDAAGNSDTALLSVLVLEESSGEGGFLPWWAYVLLAMICIFAVLGYFVLRD